MITPIRITIDDVAEAAYIRVTDAKVARTAEFTEDFLVDLDEFNMIVGVEVLNVNTEVPMAEIAREYHLPANAHNQWTMLERSSAQQRPMRLTLSVGSDGVSGNSGMIAQRETKSGELFA